jgi:sulfate adenylyltransferase subunit 1
MPARPRACCLSGITLDREVDVSRGDWIIAAPVQPKAEDDFDAPAAASPWPSSREITATVAWMDNEPLVPGRVYWALHGHRWVKAKARRVVHRLNITLDQEDAQQLEANAIGQVELVLQEAIPAALHQARQLGSLILVDTASNAAGAALVN